MKKILSLFLIILLSFSLTACSVIDIVLEEVIESMDGNQELTNEGANKAIGEVANDIEEVADEIAEDGYYTNQEDVSLYIHTHDKLPYNFITKKDAGHLGWESSKGNLWDILSTYDQPIEIRFINTDDLIEALDDYGESIIGVFEDAKEENKNIKFKITQ